MNRGIAFPPNISQVLNNKQQKINDLTGEVKYLSEQLTTTRHKLKKSQQQIRQFMQEIDKRNRFLMDRQNQINKLQNSNNFLTDMSRAEKIKIVNMIQQLNLNKKQIFQLKSINADLQVRLINKDKEINILNHRNQQMMGQMEKVGEELNHRIFLSKTNQQLMFQIQELINLNNALKQQKIKSIDQSKQLKLKLLELDENYESIRQQSRQQKDQQLRPYMTIIQQLQQTLLEKNRALNELQNQVYNKMSELNVIIPDKDKDQIKCLKNGLKFLLEEFKSKATALNNIKNNYQKFKEYDQKNKLYQKKLEDEIKYQQDTIEKFKVQNMKLKKKKQTEGASEEETKELKSILSKLLWENQACHSVLFHRVGYDFKGLVNAEKVKIKAKYVNDNDKDYGDIDNRFVTVKELIHKNKELIGMVVDKDI